MRPRISKTVQVREGVTINTKHVVKEAPKSQLITNNIKSIKRLSFISLEQFYFQVELVYQMRKTKLGLERNGALERFNYYLTN